MRAGALERHTLERHNEQKVVGGSLAEKRFGDLTTAELKKVARKYPTDPMLRKYAKAKLSLEEMSGEQEPQPCLPLRLVSADTEAGSTPWKRAKKIGQDFVVWIASRRLRACVLIICLLLLLKPPLSSLLGKYVVKSVRIIFRRLCDLIALILEGLLDEVIYQLDRLFKEALPVDMQNAEIPVKTAYLLSHAFSAVLGAAFSLLTARLPLHRAQGA